MLEWLSRLHSSEGITEIVRNGGMFMLVAIIFAETGLLAGFFLPGDSLLITAGILSNPNTAVHVPGLSTVFLNIVLVIAVIVGDQCGFFLGRRAGATVWSWKDGRFFKRKHLESSHAFYEKWGGLAIIGARYVPILRTFVPFTAGMARMPYRSYVLWSIAGGILWITSLVWLGYYLGATEWAKRIDKLIVLVVFVSILPLFIGTAKRLIKNMFGSKTETSA